ncbi:hypothetical protein ABT369_48620 [Dactylosporangium sp. NPDC000244]|uniref:hypothetical protein n=1 Tax=Dactylosporangium sp. NPDC000244 TaxID=3154365 RepID=UPI003322EC7C
MRAFGINAILHDPANPSIVVPTPGRASLRPLLDALGPRPAGAEPLGLAGRRQAAA